jgi:hypothetical protein
MLEYWNIGTMKCCVPIILINLVIYEIRKAWIERTSIGVLRGFGYVKI